MKAGKQTHTFGGPIQTALTLAQKAVYLDIEDGDRLAELVRDHNAANKCNMTESEYLGAIITARYNRLKENSNQ